MGEDLKRASVGKFWFATIPAQLEVASPPLDKGGAQEIFLPLVGNLSIFKGGRAKLTPRIGNRFRFSEAEEALAALRALSEQGLRWQKSEFLTDYGGRLTLAANLDGNTVTFE